MDEIYKHAFRVCPIWDAQAFWLMNYCGFNIVHFGSDVYGDHQRPQTPAELCRNMDICFGFRAVATRVRYPGFILFSKVITNIHWNCTARIANDSSQQWLKLWLADWQHQAITWANVYQDPCRNMASLDHNELMTKPNRLPTSKQHLTHCPLRGVAVILNV